MNVCCLGFSFKGTLEHFLSSDVLTTIQFNDAAVIQGVGIFREHALCTKARLGNCQVGARTCSDFRHLRILIEQNPKLISRLRKPTADKLFVRTLKGDQRC